MNIDTEVKTKASDDINNLAADMHDNLHRLCKDAFDTKKYNVVGTLKLVETKSGRVVATTEAYTEAKRLQGSVEKAEPEPRGRGTGTQNRIFDCLIDERQYQIKKWGYNPHEVGGWLMLIDRYMQMARESWVDHAGDTQALHSLRKAAALCLACFEQHGIPRRESVPCGVTAGSYALGECPNPFDKPSKFATPETVANYVKEMREAQRTDSEAFNEALRILVRENADLVKQVLA